MIFFSKANFLKTADKGIMKQLSGHTDILDGKEVDFLPGDIFGTIKYNFGGIEWELYPVYLEWCSINALEELK